MALEAAALLQEEAAAVSANNRSAYGPDCVKWYERREQRRAAALYAAAREAYLFGTGFTSLGVDKWGVL